MVAEPGRRARMGRVLHGMLVFVILVHIRAGLFLPAVRLLGALLHLLATSAALLVGQGQTRVWGTLACEDAAVAHHTFCTLRHLKRSRVMQNSLSGPPSIIHPTLRLPAKPFHKARAETQCWECRVMPQKVSRYFTAISQALAPPSQTASCLSTSKYVKGKTRHQSQQEAKSQSFSGRL